MKIGRALPIILASLLILTACVKETPVGGGKVIGCANIETISTSQEPLMVGCLDGGPAVDIKAVKGPALINVWGSWCEPCKEEIPILRDFYREFQSEITLIGVDVEEPDMRTGRDFIEAQGITWPNLFDSEGVTRSYFGMGVPVTWFIDAQGKVVKKHIGVITSGDQLRSLSKKYLGIS